MLTGTKLWTARILFAVTFCPAALTSLALGTAAPHHGTGPVRLPSGPGQGRVTRVVRRPLQSPLPTTTHHHHHTWPSLDHLYTRTLPTEYVLLPLTLFLSISGSQRRLVQDGKGRKPCERTVARSFGRSVDSPAASLHAWACCSSRGTSLGLPLLPWYVRVGANASKLPH